MENKANEMCERKNFCMEVFPFYVKSGRRFSLKNENHFNVVNTAERKSLSNILSIISEVQRRHPVTNMRCCKLTVTPSHMKLLEGAAVV